MKRQLSTQAHAAKLIRAELKAAGIKASVTSDSGSMTTSVDVATTDLSPNDVQRVHDIADKYQYGHFDGMTDCYNYTNSRDDIPQAKYVFVNNRYSKETMQKTWEYVRGEYHDAANLPATFSDVDNNNKIRGQWVDQFMYRFMSGNESTAFWATQKPSKAVNVSPKRMATEHDVNGVTVRDGSRDGYSEILFTAKPDTETRDALKAAKFRWSPKNSVWWGKTASLPAAYK